MLLSDKIKKFSVEQAIDYLNRNPVKNLPKRLDWADTFCAGKFEGQPRHLVRGVFPAAHRPRLPVHLVFPLHTGRQRRLARQAAAAAKKK